MTPDFFDEDHRLFRDGMRKFVEREIIPYHEQWEKDGMVSRDLWRKAGENGCLCLQVPEAYGGLGVRDYRYNMIVIDELVRAFASGPGFTVHSDMVSPYITNYGSEEQKHRYLPKMVSGEWIGAIAMTEPDTGSDLAAIKTTAVRDGDAYVVHGQKTFVTNGILNDLVLVLAKTDPGSDHQGISMLVVECCPMYNRDETQAMARKAQEIRAARKRNSRAARTGLVVMERSCDSSLGENLVINPRPNYTGNLLKLAR